MVLTVGLQSTLFHHLFDPKNLYLAKPFDRQDSPKFGVTQNIDIIMVDFQGT
jgi:hypothetical protein